MSPRVTCYRVFTSQRLVLKPAREEAAGLAGGAGQWERRAVGEEGRRRGAWAAGRARLWRVPPERPSPPTARAGGRKRGAGYGVVMAGGER